MTNTEFISYQPTSGQSYEGIITFKRFGQDILCYKWVKRKDGSGFFASAPSLKIVDDSGERYEPAHLVDSRADDKEMQEILRLGVMATINNRAPVKMSGSVFNAAPANNDNECPF